MQNESLNYKTSKEAFSKIINLLEKLHSNNNLVLSFYKQNPELHFSIFDSMIFKDKQDICKIEINRYMILDNTPIYNIHIKNKKLKRDENFWIEHPLYIQVKKLDNIIEECHSKINLNNFNAILDDIYDSNKTE